VVVVSHRKMRICINNAQIGRNMETDFQANKKRSSIDSKLNMDDYETSDLVIV